MLNRQENNPQLRLARSQDFDALYEIVMQDHVNPFMSFELMSKEEFKPLFDTFIQSSDVYVIEEAGQVVAVRRIIYYTDTHAHTACFACFGVHKDYRRRGYGEFFYHALLKLLKKERPDISRIELTQETDNDAALRLASKMGFRVEAVFPDWLQRKTGTHQDKWYIGQRFHALLLDATIKPKSVLQKCSPVLPSLREDNNDWQLEMQGKTAHGYQHGKHQASCRLSAGMGRYAHIEFWEVQSVSDGDPRFLPLFLRALALRAAQKYKKVEIFTWDQTLVNVLSSLGFHCRGEKRVSCKLGQDYFNELGMDLSFFNIHDAKQIIAKTRNVDSDQLAHLSHALVVCQRAIQQAWDKKYIDEYGKWYLENMAFQMTREGIGETRLYDTQHAPWRNLLQALPEKLQAAFFSLGQVVNILD